MKKEVFEVAKKEFRFIGILFLLSVAIFKIAFFRESFIVLVRSILSLFWLFVLPGHFIMFYWREKLEFVERIVIGIAVAAGIIGIFNYYFIFILLYIKYHIFLLPLVIILVGSLINVKFKNEF